MSKKTYYRIKGLLKMAEEDNWQEGCNPDSGFSVNVDVEFTGKSADDVIKQAADFVGCAVSGPDSGVERNSCDEIGRVDFSVMENAEACLLSKSEWEAFKQGRIKAWYCTYMGTVEKITSEVVKL